MSVSETDVRHVAALARLGLDETRIPSLVRELNGILEHMEALSKAKGGDDDVTPASAAAMPLRVDDGPQVALEHPREKFAPAIREGLLVVPRLSTHEDAAEEGA